MLDVGQTAPDFEAESSQGGRLRLSSLRGRPVVIYFYPAAFTLGCSVETNMFRDKLGQFRELGAEVLGISTDDLGTQCRFAESKMLTFPLLADPDARIARSFGAYGDLRRRAKRVTFILDAEGVVRARLAHEILVQKHVSEALEFLSRQRTAAT